MSLDKLTLHSQLAVFNQNVASLDAAIANTTTQIQQKNNELQQLHIELERQRGARQYHDLIVQQIQHAIAEADTTTN